MKDLVICGAGGFADEVACMVNRINKVFPTWNFLGYIDKDNSTEGESRRYGKILGDINLINNYPKELNVVIAIGNPLTIRKVIDEINNISIVFPNIIDPSVDFLDSDNMKMGKGNVICAKCFVSCNVKMGDFNLFNVGAGIGHDATIGNYNVVMPNVNISGGVTIGNGNLFGVKSTVMQYLKIGDGITLGANSLLIKSAKDKALYMGAPAKKIII